MRRKSFVKPTFSFRDRPPWTSEESLVIRPFSPKKLEERSRGYYFAVFGPIESLLSSSGCSTDSKLGGGMSRGENAGKRFSAACDANAPIFDRLRTDIAYRG